MTELKQCDYFGANRSVVREAITILKTDRVIETIQGRGSFVAHEGILNTFRMTNLYLEDDITIAQTFEYLIVHEVATTEIAALRRSDEELPSLKVLLEGKASAVKYEKPGGEVDVQLHKSAVCSTRSNRFISFSNYLQSGVRKLIYTARSNTLRHLRLREDVQSELQKIFDTFMAEDQSRVERASETHPGNAAKRLRIYLSGNSPCGTKQ